LEVKINSTDLFYNRMIITAQTTTSANNDLFKLHVQHVV